MSLIRKNDGVVLEDCFEKLEFVKQEDKDYNLIRLSNLPDGQYDLNLKNLPKVIKITVHKGKYWQDDSFILKRTCLMENASLQKMIKIASVNSKNPLFTLLSRGKQTRLERRDYKTRRLLERHQSPRLRHSVPTAFVVLPSKVYYV